MHVGIVIEKKSKSTCAVVEWVDGVKAEEILRNWVGTIGLSQEAAANFILNGAEVVPWDEIKNMWTPIAEKSKPLDGDGCSFCSELFNRPAENAFTCPYCNTVWRE